MRNILKKSFFTDKNFSGKYPPKSLSDNMIPYDKLAEFHYQTAFYLNLYASLYIQLLKQDDENDNDIIKFTKIIEKLDIIIDNTDNSKLSNFNIDTNIFTFYLNFFQKNYPSLYTNGNILNPILDNDTIQLQIGFNKNFFDKNEILLQTPENILGFLLYKKIYYNIILYNISIQNAIRINYLNINKIISTNTNNFKYISFTKNQQINISKDVKCELLIVGGGGGGGTLVGGGGGGGQVIFYTDREGFPWKKGVSINLTAGIYDITIGEGGTAGKNGEISSIISSDKTINFKAYGGGAGGNLNTIGNTGSNIGGAGGNGGRGFTSYNIYFNNIYNKGINGGDGGYANFNGGGGGGGIRINDNNNGKNGNDVQWPNLGKGGDGVNVDISGNNVGYGGGGGGSGDTNKIKKGGNGTHGGGNGASGLSDSRYATNGIQNTGGGGGGGCYQYDVYLPDSLSATYDNSSGASGGSGIVILRYTDTDVNISPTLSSSDIYTSEHSDKIKSLITENTKNIKQLIDTHFNNNYLIDKNAYINKINVLNTLKEEYVKTQDKLNNSIKLYNDEIDKYKSIKQKSTILIISLIIIIVIIISITIFPIFSADTNNIVYFILLLIISIIYYINFKYINENFADAIIKSGTSVEISVLSASSHAKFYNDLLPSINDYSNAINDLFNKLRTNIYTIGSKSFSRDANIYIYNMYLEKKRKLEKNQVKSIYLNNMIEIIKKQINYLYYIIIFNIYFAIILLISLILYSITPHLFIFIIILCIILISTLMIYFGFAVIQPTRMIADKKYWAYVNPASTTIKLM